MLKIYRAEMSMEITQDVLKFNKMSLDDRLELMFYMCANTTSAVHALHSILDESVAEIVDHGPLPAEN